MYPHQENTLPLHTEAFILEQMVKAFSYKGKFP